MYQPLFAITQKITLAKICHMPFSRRWVVKLFTTYKIPTYLYVERDLLGENLQILTIETTNTSEITHEIT